MSAYTDAELDAVHQFAWDNRDQVRGKGSRDAARKLLDAVAPAIAARALRDFADNRVTVQTPARMAEDLHARADQIEAGS